MIYIIICLTALVISFLTLFTGFGLGTILLPVFALFFTVETAVAMTAVVHLSNNLFKLVLVGRKVERSIFLKFVLPGVISAFAGALLLTFFAELPVITIYMIGDREFQITVLKIVIGILLIGFAFIELLPRFANIKFDKKWLPLGGAVSGFFGGLSGHQGALRSAFLSKAGLDNESFIAAGVVSSVLIDITRISVYASNISIINKNTDWILVSAAIIAAFIGAYAGSRIIKKLSIKFIQILVGTMLILVGCFLIIGLI